MRRGDESGYAILAAVPLIAVIALIATAIVDTNRDSAITVGAELDQARAAAAADAGIALALHGLLSKDPAARWSIDGRARQANFEDASLIIRVEDERGKVPINLLNEEQMTRLLEMGGLSGERLRVATDSLLDWIDDDDETRENGAERPYYRPSGIAPRNGAMLSIDEMARVRGFDPLLVARLRPFVTVYYGSGPFDARYAQPQALAIMTEGGEDSPQAIQRKRELAGQTTALEFTSETDLIGKPLSIIVDARLPDGAGTVRTQIVELTGSTLRPYVVRSYE